MSRPDHSNDLLQGSGEMGALVRAFDWSATSLGPPDQWPQSLRTALGIVLSSRYPMFVFWGTNLVQIYNDAYRPVLGAKHPWALGRPAATIWTDEWSELGPLVDRALQGDSTWAEDFLLIVTRNQFPEETYFTFSYSPIPDEGGIGGMFCACTETTGQVLAARRLLTLRELAQCATAKSVTEACVLSAEALGRNDRDVPFAIKYLISEDGGISRSASTGVPAGHPLQRDDVAAELLAECGEFSNTGTGIVLDLSRRFATLPPGPWQEPPTRAMLTPIADRTLGRAVGLMVFGISARLPFDAGYRTWLELAAQQIGASMASARAYEQQRAEAQTLADLDRAKTTFFSNVSHEFRTPLTLILGPIEEALSEAIRPEDRERLTLMQRNALRLQRLVNTLLEFARIEAGRLAAAPVPTDLVGLTLDLVSAFRAACDAAGIRLSVHSEPLRAPVAVDRDMWEKIVLNLMSNALKFTFDGEIVVTIEESAHAVTLSIRDTGTGMSAEDLARVFERFHRVEGARARTHEGSGIGLALVHELVHLNGGTITAHSTPGEGTTFVVTLPHCQSADDTAAQLTPYVPSGDVAVFVGEASGWLTPATEAVSPDTIGQPRILIVDDNADMRAYLCRLLGDRYAIDAVNDGEAALEAVRRQPPDLIVSDLMMPRLDGLGLLRRVRTGDGNASVPFLLLTARADDDARLQAMSLGVDDYLTKPFSSRELRARVDALLHMSQVRGRATDALREAEALFRDMADHSPMMVWVTDKAAACTFLSKSWYEFTGQGPESALGMGWVSALHPDDRATVQDAFFAASEVRGPYRLEHRLRAAGGRYRWVLAVAAPRFGPGEEFLGYIGSIVDITERKEAEDRRQQLLEAERQARAEAERANAVKDEFLATLSHELRAPLNTIVGWSELLEEDALDPVESREAVAIIARAAAAQSTMVEDLLDMSRIVSGQLELLLETVRLDEVLRAGVLGIRPSAEANGIDLVVSIDQRACLIHGDPDRLRQVFTNLLVNAVKFTPAGGHVSVGLHRHDRSFEISIDDTGAGIDASFLPHVFDRFRQADASAARAYGGLGIGLSIVKHLVELHGGTVTASSDGRGLGTRFTVVLPALNNQNEQLEDVAPSSAPAVNEPARPPLASIRVLIVDDDADTRWLLGRIYRGLGATPMTAASAAEALDMLTAGTFDLLVSDIGMPGEDGYDLIRRLRARPASHGGRTPAIALTAHAQPEDRRLALTTGFQRHLSKPVDQGALLRASQELIHGGGAWRSVG